MPFISTDQVGICELSFPPRAGWPIPRGKLFIGGAGPGLLHAVVRPVSTLPNPVSNQIPLLQLERPEQDKWLSSPHS